MANKGSNSYRQKKETRRYESDAWALQTLSLIAAPNPKDDLSDEELVAYFKKHKITPVMIHHIIDTVREL